MRKTILALIIANLIFIACPVSASETDDLVKAKLYTALALHNLTPHLTESLISEIMGFFKVAPENFFKFLQGAGSLLITYSVNEEGQATVSMIGVSASDAGNIHFGNE